MSSEQKLKECELSEDIYPQISLLIKENKKAWQSIGVLFAFGAGTFSIIAALLCNLIALLPLSENEARFFQGVSFVFFALFLPLMILGAHFLDLLEEKYLSL